MTNRVTEILNIEKPIIQGPMAWISTAPLVAAVSNTGGLGVLGVGFAPIEFAVEQIRASKALTDKPFAINVVLFPDMMDRVTEMIRQERPAVVYADGVEVADYDLSKKYFDIWHQLGCKVICKVGTVSDAVILEKAGADIIVAKGWEGGGHTSFEATMTLAPSVKEAISIPLVVSEGIATGRGVAAALALGGEGVEMGTVFMAAEEAAIHPNAKQAVIDCGDMDTVITGTSTGEPCRQIKNQLSERMNTLEAQLSYEEAAQQLKTIAVSSLKTAMMDGEVEEHGAVMVEQVATLVNEIRPVQEIIDTILEETQRVLTEIAL